LTYGVSLAYYPLKAKRAAGEIALHYRQLRDQLSEIASEEKITRREIAEKVGMSPAGFTYRVAQVQTYLEPILIEQIAAAVDRSPWEIDAYIASRAFQFVVSIAQVRELLRLLGSAPNSRKAKRALAAIEKVQSD
jgi:hypothetical protein